MFSRELKGKQQVVVNTAFDWAKTAPAHAESMHTVYACCCFKRGTVFLSTTFDKGAYAAGETAQVHCVIRNEASTTVKRLTTKLLRRISLNDGRGGSTSREDVVATATYEGVPPGESQARDLPLSFLGDPGKYVPATRGRLVQVSYVLQVECGMTTFVSNVATSMPVVLFQPSPAVWGAAALTVPVQAMVEYPVSPGGNNNYPAAAPNTPFVNPASAFARASSGVGYGSVATYDPQQPPAQPAYAQPPPGYVPPQPGYGPPQPGYQAQAGGYQGGAPGWQQPTAPPGWAQPPPQSYQGAPAGQQYQGAPPGYPPQQQGPPYVQQPLAGQ